MLPRGARKGTLIHYILENIDYNKVCDAQSLKTYINELISRNKVSKDDIKLVDINKISKFLYSDLACEIRNSSNVKKETEFVLRNSEYTKSTIQGIIDLYFENENGNYTLVDFKTDRMDKEELFIEKYGIQLKIYKEALEKITSKKVDNIYIYSFNLDKKIKMV